MAAAEHSKPTGDAVEHIDIPIGDIIPNPRNPRPLFHLQDDDPFIAELAASLKTDGQFQDAMVFPLQGHWCEPDRPGMYMLLQGERRWRASIGAKRPSLRCQVRQVPKDYAEELFALGAEGSFKEDWQRYYVMKWARDLAIEMGRPMDDTVIRQRTGLTKPQLIEANKMFSLQPDIVKRVEVYEEELYRQRLGGMRKMRGRLRANEAGIAEFTVGRAASVWELFTALRDNFDAWDLVRDRTDLELQTLLADAATGRRSKHSLDNLIHLVRMNRAGSCDPALRVELDKLLTKRTTIGEAGLRFGFADLERYRGLEKKIESLSRTIADLNRQKYAANAALSEADLNRGLRKLQILSREMGPLIAAIERRAAVEEERRLHA